MIKANELRRGNWLMGTKPVQVDQILSDTDVGIASGGNPYSVYAEAPFKPCLEPIPLTEEILEKAGFEDYCGGYYKRGSFGVDYSHVNKSYKISANNVCIYIDYLHQLQNTYFCLTGKELEINL